MATLKAFFADEGGATSIEYALIGGLLSILIVAGATSIGTKLRNNYFAPANTGLS